MDISIPGPAYGDFPAIQRMRTRRAHRTYPEPILINPPATKVVYHRAFDPVGNQFVQWEFRGHALAPPRYLGIPVDATPPYQCIPEELVGSRVIGEIGVAIRTEYVDRDIVTVTGTKTSPYDVLLLVASITVIKGTYTPKIYFGNVGVASTTFTIRDKNNSLSQLTETGPVALRTMPTFTLTVETSIDLYMKTSVAGDSTAAQFNGGQL